MPMGDSTCILLIAGKVQPMPCIEIAAMAASMNAQKPGALPS